MPSRYYRFTYGGLADFFALDSTTNSESGPPRAAYSKDGDQYKWLQENLGQSRTPWKIPYFHHPPFNAGPRHPATADELSHFVESFKREGVKVVFTGHEHNFQFSKKSGETGGIRYVVSGAGGELRSRGCARVDGSCPDRGLGCWFTFPVGRGIQGREMRITPMFALPTEVVTKDGQKVTLPLRVSLD